MGPQRILAALLFPAVMSLVSVRAQLRGCNETALATESSLQKSIELVFGNASTGDSPILPAVTIFRQSVVCLAAAEVRYEYTFASVVVSFDCHGDLPTGSPLGSSCSANYTSQFDFECEPSTLEWVPSSIPLLFNGTNLFEEADATFDTALERSCSLCVDPAGGESVSTLPVDAVTHCSGNHPTPHII